MKPGTRLRSAVDDTELIVVKGSDDNDIELRCGGHPVIEHGGGRADGLEPGRGPPQRDAVGKRYTDAEATMSCCARRAERSLSIGDERSC